MADIINGAEDGKMGLFERMRHSLEKKDKLLEQYAQSEHWSVKKVKEEMQQQEPGYLPGSSGPDQSDPPSKSKRLKQRLDRKDKFLEASRIRATGR